MLHSSNLAEARANQALAQQSAEFAKQSTELAQQSQDIAKQGAELAQQSRDLGQYTAILAQQTSNDSASMITIATVTMFFLPATFVSVSIFIALQ
jgi:Mg2+ and Co2+ transporter CorA